MTAAPRIKKILAEIVAGLIQTKWFGTDGGEFTLRPFSCDPTETEDEI
jgi:hypothetical protein